MCLNKICDFYRRNKQLKELRQKHFAQKLEEVLGMTVSIDGQKCLKAKELLAFMGVELERLKEDTARWAELQKAIVVTRNGTNANETFAFNANIVKFLKKHYTNPDDALPISVVKEAYKQLKKFQRK